MNISWKQFQINTKNIKPRTILIKAMKELNDFVGNAIDIGCGSGNDTVYLIKRGWNVLAIDREPYGFLNIEKKIGNRLSMLETLESSFENLIDLPAADLVISNNSLPFCKSSEFNNLWNKIEKAIKKDGMFVGNFFGKNDSWATNDTVHFLEKKEINQMFKNFNIIYFKEIEKDEKTGFGEMRHWHIYEIIATKR